MNRNTRIHIPLRASVTMLRDYARQRLGEQVRAVAFIVFYLTAFQILVLRQPPENALSIGVGVGMVVLGLTFFLEGLLLGLMPLGERVGMKFPQRVGLLLIVLFGFFLGIGSTLAEPAIAALRAMGSGIKAWEAPLLFHLLENDSGKLVVAIGIGVGLAVALGMIRLFFALSIKPFVYVLIPVLLGVSAYCTLDANLGNLLGLAWDAGAVTTGPVTVPLVMALGIGVSRSIRGQRHESGGFGMIMLASALPILAVLVLGMSVNPAIPRPMAETEFFAPENRAQALQLFASPAALSQHAFSRGSEAGRRAFFNDENAYREAVRSLAGPDGRRELLGRMTLDEWRRQHASERERIWLASLTLNPVNSTFDGEDAPGLTFREMLASEFSGALRAVAPLTLLLLVTLMFFLRDRLRYNDELALGIAICVLGMALLTGGIRIGLAPLGDNVGRSLPRVFSATPTAEDSFLLLTPFDSADILHAYSRDGQRTPYFLLKGPDGEAYPVRFDSDQFDPQSGFYEHVLRRKPLFHPRLTFAGVGLVLLFAFGLGYGSTLAEPALAALGRKVEEITVGTVRRKGMVRAVSIGVGFGLVAGVIRLLYDIPTLWLLAPPYLLLLWMTRFSEEDFAGIAWDCGGVTTGPVTVPLVMAMGLGVGGELRIVDGFGTLAMASAYPIVTVMAYGLLLRARQKRTMQAAGEKDYE